METKTYILFDLDGTLTDPKEGITKAVQYSLKSFGIETDAETLTPFIGPPLKESFMRFYGFSGEDAALAVSKYREYFSEIGIYENKVYPGIAELLEKLRETGKLLILATSKPKVFAERILRHFDLYSKFSFIAGSELDGRRTKKGEVISYALKNMGIKDIENAVMIGDREHDIIGASENGIESVGVLYGYGGEREFMDAGASRIVGSVAELAELLMGFGADERL